MSAKAIVLKREIEGVTEFLYPQTIPSQVVDPETGATIEEWMKAKTSYVSAWDGESIPVPANIPAGVVVTYNNVSYTGTMAASAGTMYKFFLVSDGAGQFYLYITSKDGSSYYWANAGKTTPEYINILNSEINYPTLGNSYYWNISPNGLLRYVASGATKSTDPIFCKKGTVVLTNENTQFSTDMSFITKVSATNEGIECLVRGDESTQRRYWYAVEEDCYICISVLSAQVSKVRLIPNDGLEYLLDYIRDKHDNLIRIDKNPLEHIIRDCGYGSVIHHWGIVGDSLSSGEIHIRNAGHNTYIDYYAYSWGQRFAKMNCAESCYNFSNGGQTAKGWIEGTVDGSSDIVHGDDYIGGVGGGGWPLAKTDGYKKQAYIIALGVNDHSESYPTGSVSTDIGTYDSTTDTDTNADSFVGYYAGIIQRLRSIQPNAKIFCVTMPNNAFPNESAAIADIVDYFSTLYSGDVYLIDLSTYLPIKWGGDYMYNTHGSAQGYQYIAYAVNTYVDWIIRNNADDFKTMPLLAV